MRQKHLCRVFHCCRCRIWNACRICSLLWPEMGERLVHLQEMSSDCWGKWTLLVQGASKASPSMSRSTWPPDSCHKRSSSPLQLFVFICIESSEKPHSFGGGHFHGRLVVSPMHCLWDEGLVFHACGQQLHGCLRQGGVGMGPCSS